MERDRRLGDWIDLVADLLQRPRPEFPLEEIGCQLTRTFEVRAVSWDWRHRPGSSGFRTWPPLDFTPVADLPAWHQERLLNRHPLLRWFVVTQDPTPQTLARVPNALAPARDRALIRLYLAPMRIEHQLSMPYLLDGSSYEAFILARAGEDFSDEDVLLAGHLNGLVRALHRRTSPLAGRRASCRAAAAAGLTTTELAVLVHLADGHTAQGIGRRLAISPRTAQKHLEHIYRKLGVNDRLGAVIVARQAGLLPPTTGLARHHDTSPTGDP